MLTLRPKTSSLSCSGILLSAKKLSRLGMREREKFEHWLRPLTALSFVGEEMAGSSSSTTTVRVSWDTKPQIWSDRML